MRKPCTCLHCRSSIRADVVDGSAECPSCGEFFNLTPLETAFPTAIALVDGFQIDSLPYQFNTDGRLTVWLPGKDGESHWFEVVDGFTADTRKVQILRK